MNHQSDRYLLEDLSPSQDRVPSLDGLRALCVLGVLLSHFVSELPGKPVVVSLFSVQLFFVMSGFIITRLLLAELNRTGSISIRAFYFRRLLRLTPPLFLMIGLTLALQWAYGMSNSIMAFCTALYLSNYCMASGISLDSMVSLWSLAVEEHFYILFPLLLIVSARYGMRAVYICLLCVFCAALGARIGYALADKPVNYIHWRTESVMDLIIAGCAIAVMSSHDAGRMVLRAMATTTIFLLTSAVYVLALVSMAPSDKLHLAFDQSVLSIWLAVLLINTLCNPDFALLRRILNHPAAVWIGGISYSVYVWHCLVMFFQYRYELIAGPFSIAAAVAITLLLGAASSRFIERPIAARRKIWSERLGIRPRPIAALQG